MADAQRMKEIDAWIDENWETIISEIETLVNIPSQEDLDHAAPGAPFGPGPRAALDWFLRKAGSYGLKTGELDGYCGWAEYGAGDRMIGMLCHLDVVPADPAGWTSAPYSAEVRDGVLAVCCIDGDFTLKRVRVDRGEGCLWLVPANPDYRPIRVSQEDDFRIWGVVRYVIKKF